MTDCNNFDSSSDEFTASYDSYDSYDAEMDARKNEAFLDDYFDQQKLRIQHVYNLSNLQPPMYRESNIPIYERNSFNANNRRITLNKNSSQYITSQIKYQPSSHEKRNLKTKSEGIKYVDNPMLEGRSSPRKHELKGLILDSLERLGIECFARKVYRH
jgi:hypothetical protein